MAQRYGRNAIEDAIVALLNDNLSDLNSGLLTAVKQIITTKPDDIVIGLPKYPSVCVAFISADREFEGASKRINDTAHYEVHFWTLNRYSIDKSRDEADQLLDNILFIFDSNIAISSLSSTRGFLLAKRVAYDYNTGDSGFITHGFIELDVTRILN